MQTAKSLQITITKDIRLEEIPETLDQFLINRLEVPNPKWLENERMGRWNWETPRTLCFYTRMPDGVLILPRETMGQLIRRCINERALHTGFTISGGLFRFLILLFPES